MGRTAVADEGLWSYLKRFDHDSGFVVGLIIGQASKTTDYVVHLARTPPPVDPNNDDISKPVPSGSTIPSLKDIDQAWLAEHALQVTRMLPGGIWILGLFLVGPTDPFTTQAECSRFRSLLRHIRTQLNQNPNLSGDSPCSEKLLLHVNNGSKSISCHALDVDGGGSFLKATWKFEKEPVVWQQVECVLDLQQVVHLSESDSSPPVQRPLQVFLDAVLDNVTNAICGFEGEIRDSDELLEHVSKKPKGKSGSSGSSRKSTKSKTRDADSKVPLHVNLFVPMNGLSKDTPKEKVFTCSERMHIAGNIVGRVFLNPKATVEEAVRAVKQDLIRSLAARIEMHLDSLVEEEQGHSEGNASLHEPPRRVMIPIPFSSITLYDYLFAGEGSQEVLTSCHELLDLTIKEKDVQDILETQADVNAQDWKTIKSDSSVSKPGGSSTDTNTKNADDGKQRMFKYLCGISILFSFLAMLVQNYMLGNMQTTGH